MPLFNNSERGQLLIITLIMGLVIGSVMMVGGFSLPKNKATGTPFTAEIQPDNSASDKQNLQLKTINFSGPTPAVSVGCNHDNGLPSDPNCNCFQYILLECKDQKCIHVLNQTTDAFCQIYDAWCQSDALTHRKDGVYCLGKPVIYLYPTSIKSINISIQTSGKITVSNPIYPAGGWKNVEAHPDGSLIYNDRSYSELFYETDISEFLRPSDGIIIPVSNLKTRLKQIIYNLGLNDKESSEFLDFWIPKLKKLNSNYILFSLIDPPTKENIDHVSIDPVPDTRIEFLAYFKPLNIPEDVSPLMLPQRPVRRGFVEVEWGGTIDTSDTLLY